MRLQCRGPICVIRQHTSAYVSIREHTSAYVSIGSSREREREKERARQREKERKRERKVTKIPSHAQTHT